jgi:hypothetical protein
MRCYRVTERVKKGLLVHTEHEQGQVHPFIPTPDGCPMRLFLDTQLTAAIQSCDPVELRLVSARVEFADGYILFRSAPRSHDRQAFVRVETAGGVDGQVKLTANSYTTALKKSGHFPEVARRYAEFPDAGVVPFCTPEELDRVAKGVDFLDVLLVMHKGASFRIERTGELDGASPELFVHWNGYDLKIDVPRRYREAAVAVLEPAGCAAG